MSLPLLRVTIDRPDETRAVDVRPGAAQDVRAPCFTVILRGPGEQILEKIELTRDELHALAVRLLALAQTRRDQE